MEVGLRCRCVEAWGSTDGDVEWSRAEMKSFFAVDGVSSEGLWGAARATVEPWRRLASGLLGGVLVGGMLLGGTLLGDGALAAELPALLVVNGGDATLDLRSLPEGPLQRHWADLPMWATDLAVWEDYAYVTGAGDDRIARLDLRSGAVELDWLGLPAFSSAWGIVIRDARHGYVVLAGLNAVQAFDPSRAELVGEPLPLGNWPEGCLLLDDQLYVAVTGFDFGSFSYVDPSVVRVDLDRWEVAAVAPVHPNPQALATWGGEIYAVCTGDYGAVESAVAVLAAGDLAPRGEIAVGGTAGSIEIGPDGIGYLGDNGFVYSGIYSFDAAARALLRGPADPLSGEPTSACLVDAVRGAFYSTSYDFSAGTLVEWSWPELEAVGAEVVGGGPVALGIWDLPLVDLELGAVVPSPVVPGEAASLDLTLENRAEEARVVRLAVDLFRGDGSAVNGGAPVAEVELSLPAGAVVQRTVERTVPAALAAGEYELVGRVLLAEEAQAGVQVDAASVAFEVSVGR
jgi:hypothetical protein